MDTKWIFIKFSSVGRHAKYISFTFNQFKSLKLSNTLGNLIYGGCDKSFTVTPDGGLIYLCKSARGYWNANAEDRPILYLKQGKLNVTLRPEPTLNKAGKIIKSRSSRNSPLSNRIKQ